MVVRLRGGLKSCFRLLRSLETNKSLAQFAVAANDVRIQSNGFTKVTQRSLGVGPEQRVAEAKVRLGIVRVAGAPTWPV